MPKDVTSPHNGYKVVQDLVDSLKWALGQINHVDISTPEYRDGVHAYAEPNCEICKMYRQAKRAIRDAEHSLQTIISEQQIQ